MTAAQHQRIKDIFLRACDLPADQRTGFLEEACGSDADLRAGVERMLVHDDDPAGLEHGVAVRTHIERLLDSDASGFPSNPPPVEPPPTIAGYRIIDVLGEGGFGTVYRAEQYAPVRRTVALKVIKPGMDSRQVIARFSIERQALAAMEHPSFARVYDAGQTEAGRFYFAMELVPGVPLTRYCDDHDLGLLDRLRLFTRVCNAVQHAHQKGLIHRDLKPSNVLVTEHDGQPLPKLIDFGIARAIHAAPGESTLVTVSGQFIGTPEYMSPEQAAGSADIDTRSDIYSLGVLLYELLTGTTPLDRHRSQEVAPATPAQLQRMIAESEPPPPSVRLRTIATNGRPGPQDHGGDPRALARQVRGDLDWIAMRALESDRERRYESAAALADDISRYLQHEPVAARPPTTAYRLYKFARKHRIGLAVTAALVVMLLVGGIGLTFGLFQALAARDAEAAERRRADTQAAAAKAIATFLNDDLLTAASPSARGRDVTVRTILDEAAGRVKGRFAGQPLVESGVRLAIGRAYLSLGEYELADPQLVAAQSLCAAALGPDAAESLDAARALGYLRSEQGRLADAETVLSDVLARRRAQHPHAAHEIARDTHFLARNHVRRGRLTEAVAIYRELVDSFTALLGPDHEETLTARSNLVGALEEAEQFDALPEILEATLAAQTRVHGPDHPNTLYTRGKLAQLALQTGRLAEAEARFEELLPLMQRVFGAEHPYTMFTMGDLCSLYYKQARYDEAEPLRVQVVNGLTNALGAEHPETMIARERLGDLYYSQQRFEEAEPIYAAVLRFNRANFGEAHAYARVTQLRLARTYLGQRRPLEAEKLLESLVAAADDMRRVEYLVTYADALAELERVPEAERALREALAIPANTPRLQRDHADAARALEKLCGPAAVPAERADR